MREMKKIVLTSLVFILVLLGGALAEQPGKQQKDSSMQGMRQEMMKGKESGESGMGEMMRMMRMMEQCGRMMEQCCPMAGSGEAKEGQNK